MRIYDLIAKKRDGGTHTREELEAIVNGFVSGEVADYQMAAWMMAVYLRGMTNEETAELTDVMAHSGVMVEGIVYHTVPQRGMTCAPPTASRLALYILLFNRRMLDMNLHPV